MTAYRPQSLTDWPWPPILAGTISLCAVVAVAFMHPDAFSGVTGEAIAAAGPGILLAGLLPLLAAITLFARAVVSEMPEAARQARNLRGARVGIAAFIVSEGMLFAALLGAYIYLALGSASMGLGRWPPAGIAAPNAWPAPVINTALLLISGVSTVVAHHSFLSGQATGARGGLAAAIALGVGFLAIQASELAQTTFSLSDGAYPSAFLIATGMHGLHVLIGVVLLSIALARLLAGHFTREAHFGLEGPIWYWHFVDAVWLLLFAIVYL